MPHRVPEGSGGRWALLATSSTIVYSISCHTPPHGFARLLRLLALLQAQIAALENAIAAAAARAAHLKAKAAQGEVAQSRLCLGGGSGNSTNGNSSSSNSSSNNSSSVNNSSSSGGGAATAAGEAGGEVVSLEDLSKKVVQVWQR